MLASHQPENSLWLVASYYFVFSCPLLTSIHCGHNQGMFVSESKFLSDTPSFIPHILNRNEEALDALITKPAVEAALLVRLEKKARWYGMELGPDGEMVPGTGKAEKVSAEQVVGLYRDYIIPLTKEVEVRSV